MKASVGLEGAILSPGLTWEKALKTAACFHTSSSSLPSITGGLSHRGMRIGLAFSGGTVTTCLPALVVEAGDGDAAGVWVAVLSVAAPVDWAATGKASKGSEPNNRIRCFAAIKANRPTKSDFS